MGRRIQSWARVEFFQRRRNAASNQFVWDEDSYVNNWSLAVPDTTEEESEGWEEDKDGTTEGE